MMQKCYCFVLILLIYTAFLPVVHAIDGFPAGSYATADKPQSKAWYHDGCWWCILFDGAEGSYFYKLVDDRWEKGTFPDALVYPEAYTRADVLSKGDTLFVLEWEAASPRLYKYTYDDKEKTYHLLTGFPAQLSVPEGHETMVIAQDSRGKLWIPFELNGKVKVICSTSDDHRIWNTEGVEIADGLNDDDIASIIAFDGQIGVFWSNQNTESLHFRIHRDGDPEDEWQMQEIAASGRWVADDHVNLALSDDGRIFAASKTSADETTEPIEGPTEAQFILNVRSSEGIWKFYDVAEVSPVFKSRPIVVLDEENDEVYVFYRDGEAIVLKRSPMTDIHFDAPPVTVLAKPGVILSNVTSTKQNVTSETGLLVLAAGNDRKAYSKLMTIEGGKQPMKQTIKVGAIQAKRRLISYKIPTVEAVLAEVRASMDILVPLAEKAAEMGCDIIAFPEDTPGTIVWTAGHPDEAGELLRLTEKELLTRFGEVAAKHGMYIIFGSDTVEDGEIYCSAILIGRDGSEIGRYHKVHPPRHEGSKPGDGFPVFDAPGIGTIGMCICYDITMPETTRALTLAGADIVFHITMGGASMVGGDASLICFKARAIENYLYLVVTHRSGGNMIINPRGEILAEGGREPDAITTADIDLTAGREAGDAHGGITTDFRARLFRERNPRAYGILMEEHPPILDKLKHIHVPTKEEAVALGAEAFTTGPDEFYEADRLLSEGKTEEAKRRFEELSERFGTTWIGQASRDRLKRIAENQE